LGLGVVWLATRFTELKELKRFISHKAAGLFALFLALSPGMIFFSRYGIHEMGFLFFSLLFFLANLRVMAVHRTLDLWMLGTGLCGMILLKETWIIHVFILGACTLFVRPIPRSSEQPRYQPGPLLLVSLFFAFVIFFIYSGFFHHLEGVIDLFKSFKPWIQRSVVDPRFFKPLYFWVELIALSEPFALIGLFLSVYFLVRRKSSGKFEKWLSLYALGILLVYSLIPYKTPWCGIEIIWPFFLLTALFLSRATSRYILAFTCLLIILSTGKSISLNLFNYDQGSEFYIFNQTTRTARELYTKVLTAAQKNPELYRMKISIFRYTAPPLPWVFEDFSNVVQEGKLQTVDPDSLFIIANKNNRPLLESRLKNPYYVRTFIFDTEHGETYAYFDARIFRSEFEHDPLATLLTPPHP
jgi:uncharacterized protein (TIGR03663 family)